MIWEKNEGHAKDGTYYARNTRYGSAERFVPCAYGEKPNEHNQDYLYLPYLVTLDIGQELYKSAENRDLSCESFSEAQQRKLYTRRSLCRRELGTRCTACAEPTLIKLFLPIDPAFGYLEQCPDRGDVKACAEFDAETRGGWYPQYPQYPLITPPPCASKVT